MKPSTVRDLRATLKRGAFVKTHKKQEPPFDRIELTDLRLRADAYATEVPNPHWKRAFLALAEAADRCDAMLARTEAGADPPEAA